MPSHSAQAISFGQVDTFQNGTNMGWDNGGSPNPPTNLQDGGPAGAGDRFLRNVSTGNTAGQEGSRMIIENTSQWSGNYNAAGVNRLTMHMANFGSSPLYMRVALNRTFVSSSAAVLPPDGVWRQVEFDLTSSAMTLAPGAGGSLTQVLNSVNEVRIISRQTDPPDYRGDQIVGTLGLDNIIGRDIANFRFRITDIAHPNNTPTISFNTISGRSYRVERKNGITDADWVPLTNATNVAGTGGIVQVSDTEAAAGSLPSRFYRAVLLPPS